MPVVTWRRVEVVGVGSGKGWWWRKKGGGGGKRVVVVEKGW